MEDGQIVEQFLRRDERAIESTIKKYGAYCTSIAKSILGSDEDAEECASDTWLRAWGAIPPAKPANLRAFLGKLTRNLAITRLEGARTKKRGGGELMLVLDELEGCVADKKSVEEEVESRELSSYINAFLETLPERDRALFVSRYFECLPIKKIAERYMMSGAHVRTALYRTREKMKKYLKEAYGYEKH